MIVLFMDKAGCHPEDLVGKYSNIKIAFLPANTIAILQPLDLGIIKTFQVYYRKLLLSQVEECSSAYDVFTVGKLLSPSGELLKRGKWCHQILSRNASAKQAF